MQIGNSFRINRFSVLVFLCMLCSDYRQLLSEYSFAYGLKTEMCYSSTNVLASPTEKERKHTIARVQIEYGSDCFQVRFGLVMSTVWIGSKYGFVILLNASASESHMLNSTRTAPFSAIMQILNRIANSWILQHKYTQIQI